MLSKTSAHPGWRFYLGVHPQPRKGKRHMNMSGGSCNRLAVISSMVSLALAAQAGDPTDLLLKKLNEQFVPTVFNQDETDIIHLVQSWL